MTDRPIERWTTAEGRRLSEEVLLRLRAGRSLDDLGLPMVGGRVDLRGTSLARTTLSASLQRGSRSFVGVTLRDLDFGEARIANLQFDNSELINCRFDGANCEEWKVVATRFDSCTFRRSKLRYTMLGCGLGHGRRNEWLGVDFVLADLRDAIVHQAVFQDCDFSHAKINKIEFRQCEIVGSTFAGRIRDVLFECREMCDIPASPPFSGLDLSAATFDMCMFYGCEFEDTVFPADPDTIVVRNYPEAARHAIGALRGNRSPAADTLTGRLRYDLEGPEWSPASTVILNRLDFAGDPDGEGALALAKSLFGSSI